jgi:glycine oxidase
VHIVVVGGGITGAFTTYHLARLGIETTLVERGEIGGEASGANPGGLNPHHGPGIPGPMHELARASFRLHAESWEAIGAASGIEFHPRFPPRVHLAADEAEAERLRATAAPYEASPGFSARWLDREELVALDSGLAGGAAVGGLLTEGNARIEPAAYTRAVAAAAVDLGARIVHGEVRDLDGRDGRTVAVGLGEAGELDCDAAVIATGPWCAEPARWLGLEIPVQPLKGELLHVAPAGGPPAVDLAWAEGAIYANGPGGALLGGTEEPAGFDRTPSAAARAAMLERAARFYPDLAEAPVLDQTAALRPVTPDGIPIVGIAHGWENVCLAVGSGRKGMLLSAAIGQAAAELASTGATRLPVAQCSPGRWVEAAP